LSQEVAAVAANIMLVVAAVEVSLTEQ